MSELQMDFVWVKGRSLQVGQEIFVDTASRVAIDRVFKIFMFSLSPRQGCSRFLPAQVFFGMHLSTIRCTKTNTLISEVEEHFSSLSLPVTKSWHRGGQSLKVCMYLCVSMYVLVYVRKHLCTYVLVYNDKRMEGLAVSYRHVLRSGLWCIGHVALWSCGSADK